MFSPYDKIQFGAVKHGQFSHKDSQKTPIAHPLGRGMGCFLVDPVSDRYSASVPVIMM